MHRIEKQLRKTEQMLIFLASQPLLSSDNRDSLTEVLSSHMETVNRFKLLMCTLGAKR